MAGNGLSASYGVVDMQMIILSVEEGKSARKQLEGEIKSKEQILKKSKAELEKLNTEWQAQAPLLSEKAKLEKQKMFQEKLVSLRNAEMEFHAEIKRKEQKATKTIADKVAMLVAEIAEKDKLTIVFERNSSGVLYVEKPLDLTQQVIKKYNKEHKAKKQ